MLFFIIGRLLESLIFETMKKHLFIASLFVVLSFAAKSQDNVLGYFKDANYALKIGTGFGVLFPPSSSTIEQGLYQPFSADLYVNNFLIGSRIVPNTLLENGESFQFNIEFGYAFDLGSNWFLEPRIGFMNWYLESTAETNAFETNGEGLTARLILIKEFPFKERHAFILGFDPSYYYFYSWSNNQNIGDQFLTTTLLVGYKYRFGL